MVMFTFVFVARNDMTSIFLRLHRLNVRRSGLINIVTDRLF